ncbi:MAG: zinc-ribbon domain-containing protein [Peptoniphilus sp.]|nr:zinc-ribbon domain-containing protein [Peptoniphilus sp.]MDD7362719.1 zinc-ribbon domain-containing protein [Bacillota bacterium]MDY6044587.1 zinc-ribbon domain-containing protein [Peptoniphilus sp.]
MYCFRCGEELVEGAKFCHVCGANQEESRKLFEKRFKNSSPDYQNHSERDSGGDTKVAYSSDPDDGAYLKSYLNKVDTHVSENLKKHETLSGIANAPSKHESAHQDDGDVQRTAEDEKDVEQTVQEQPEKPKKKSFSDIWNSFIDEEDNPYSVFGDMADRMEHDERALASENEDMLRVSQDVEDERYDAQTGDVGTINKKVNAILDEQEREANKKKLTPKGVLSSFFSRKRDDEAEKKNADDTFVLEDSDEDISKAEKDDATVILNPSDELDEATSDTRSTDDEAVISPADAHSHISPSFDDMKEDVDDKTTIFAADDYSRAERASSDREATGEKDATISPEDDDAALFADADLRAEQAFENEDASSKGGLKGFFARLQSKEDSKGDEPSLDDRDNIKTADGDAKTGAKKRDNARLDQFESYFKLGPASNRLQLARQRVLEKGQQGFRGLLGVGVVLSALPVFFAFRRISVLPFIFTILKVVIDLCAFYFANNVARKNTYVDDDERSRNIDNLLLWILYLIPTTIVFFILPSSFAMGRTVLGSVTPHILVSVVLYVWVLFLALSTVQDQLPKGSRTEFLAWYGIIFISINLIAKLFWIIAIFLTSTFA